MDLPANRGPCKRVIAETDYESNSLRHTKIVTPITIPAHGTGGNFTPAIRARIKTRLYTRRAENEDRGIAQDRERPVEAFFKFVMILRISFGREGWAIESAASLQLRRVTETKAEIIDKLSTMLVQKY